MLERQLHLPAPGANICQMANVSYIDDGLTRQEILATETEGGDDAPRNHARRISRDNGRTWSEPESIEGDVNQQLEGGGIAHIRGGASFDPHAKRTYARLMRRIWPGMPLYTYAWGDHEHPFNDHTFVIEPDGSERLMRYEDGPDYDPANPFDPVFCDANRAYFGVGMDFAPDGTAWFAMVCYRRGSEYSFNRGGVVLMRRDPASGEWLASTQRYVAPDVSSRGMLEPDIARLRDGALLVVCRGSDTPTTPGRKWMTVSTDGGRTLSAIEPLRYDDGGEFYSPSSIHSFFRSTRNGQLYWLANIVDAPPSGNGPRYPLYIAEIDEAKPAVIRDSLVLVDTRRDGEPETVQISNWSLLENRETLDVEIYLSRIGEHAERFWETGVYRYTFSPPA